MIPLIGAGALILEEETEVRHRLVRSPLHRPALNHRHSVTLPVHVI